jgi:hypothetical protein
MHVTVVRSWPFDLYGFGNPGEPSTLILHDWPLQWTLAFYACNLSFTILHDRCNLSFVMYFPFNI